MLVIFAVALVALLLFAGLAVDAGVLYVSYGHLKRSLDAAAVAAANNFKRGQNTEMMKAAALEVLTMNSVDVSQLDLKVYICDGTIFDSTNPGANTPDGERDSQLETLATNFYWRCPDTTNGESPRKLVYLDANQHTPFYFLSLLGISGANLNTNSTAEAAAVDLVLVIDTSESMGYDPDLQSDPYYTCKPGNCSPNYPSADPTIRGCNTVAWDDPYRCSPLDDAQEAARYLVQNYMYDGYDQVAIVTFDTFPNVVLDLNNDMIAVVSAIENIGLHDDPPAQLLRRTWITASSDGPYGAFNPVNPEDRDGDGLDRDDGILCDDLSDGILDGWDPDYPFTWPGGRVGIPCDDPTKLDSFDWNDNGVFDESDHEASLAWLAANKSLSVLSTCTGCGIRVGANQLKANGRTNSLWVMILLSDGQVNLSDAGKDNHTDYQKGDTLEITDNVPASLPNGYCTGGMNKLFWSSSPPCIDDNTSTRYCVDADPDECPPDAPGLDVVHITPTHLNNLYSVDDYARDMIDEAALTVSKNLEEPRGNDITIFSIGLKVNDQGEALLRYAANIGEDGNRENPPNCAAKTSCGNYYFAVSGDDLLPIFEKIATRIYTRITD